MANFIENFFSSIFGGGGSNQQQATTTTTSTPALPPEIAPFAKEALGEAQRLYKMRGEEGYVPYTGEQLAGFTPDQLKAFQGISSLVGRGDQYFDPAARLAASSAISPTSESVQQFMSPYMQNVVDIQQREAKRQADIEAQRLAGQAVQGAGGYGGSRQAILEAELARNTQQQLGDIQAKGLAAAYEDAQSRLAQQRQREASAAGIFGNLGTAAPATALQELTALQGVGGVQQAQSQAGLDITRRQFEEERAFPEQQLSTYMNFIRGTPNATGGTSTQTSMTPAPSYLQQLAGLGLGAAGFAKAFTFKEGGKIGNDKGGLSSIIVKRAKGGPVRLQVGGVPQLRGRDDAEDIISRILLSSGQGEEVGNGQNEDGSYFSKFRPTVLDFLRSQKSATEQSAFDIDNIRRRRAAASARDEASRAEADKVYEDQRLLSMQRPPIMKKEPTYTAADKPAWMFGPNRADIEARRAALEPEIKKIEEEQAARPLSEKAQRVIGASGQSASEAKPAATGIASLAGTTRGLTEYDQPAIGGMRAPAAGATASTPSAAPSGPLTAGGAAAFSPEENDGAMDAMASPLARLGQSLGSIVSAQPEKKDAAEDIFATTQKKLAEATAAKKKGMEERSAALDQAKWLSLAELGASILAQPGGQTLLQAIGKGAKESGIIGKVAALTDKQKELAANLADVDINQIKEEFQIGSKKLDQIDRDRKAALEERKTVVEERGAGARDITAEAARRTADAAVKKALTDEQYRKDWLAVQLRNADIKEALNDAKNAFSSKQAGALAKILKDLSDNGNYDAIAAIGMQFPETMPLATSFLANKPPAAGGNVPPSRNDIIKGITGTKVQPKQ